MSELEPKARISLAMFDEISISVTMTLSAREWREFELATQKSGGAISRKIVDAVKPELDRVGAARELLSKRNKEI